MWPKCKKRLSQDGFVLDSNSGSSLVRKVAFLEQSVWKVKLKFDHGSFNIRLGIGYKDNFKASPFTEILISTDLRSSERPKLGAPGKIWKPAEEPAALEALVRFGLPWLGHFSKPEELVDYLESHLRETSAPGDHRKLSLLNYEMGRLRSACKHAQAWLDHIPNTEGWAEERARTRRQLDTMECTGNKGRT